MITATNEDNMIMMKRYHDNYFDLAIVDPPYGIDIDKHANHGGGKRPIKKYNKVGKKWDVEIPTKEYFNELKRVSKNQIIWGGNYFLDYLNSTRCFIIWDKIQEFSGADFEMAWTSFNKASKSFRKSRVEFHNEDIKIHPTQKAVSLYKWILTNYAEKGFKILDTHRGSASLDIACHDLGYDLVTCEIDSQYFEDGNKRLKQYQSQLTIF
jgi:site-specific DNA-methyltransferase (adenine-specific)